MTELIRALNEIMDWLEQNMPEYASSFLPGLTPDQILDLMATSGYSISGELFELYQWRNGTNFYPLTLVAPFFELMPLEEVIRTNAEADNDSMIREFFTFDEQPLLPFMASDGYYYAVPISPGSILKSSVIDVPKQGLASFIAFSNVTSMMKSLAECLTSGAYYLDVDGCVDAHLGQVANVLRKHNSELVDKALADIRILQSDFDVNFDTLMFISRTLQSLERFRPPGTIEILNSALEKYRLDEDGNGNIVCDYINRSLSSLSVDS
jgi:hypothetical protein